MPAYNNPPNDAAQQGQRSFFTVRIDRIIDKPDSRVKGIVSITLGGAFAIHDILVMEGQNGLFVKMPFKSYTKNGNVTYEDVAHPISAAARTEVNNMIMDAFQQKFSPNGTGEYHNQGNAFPNGRSGYPGGGNSYSNGRNAYSKPQRGYPVLVEPDPDNPFDK